jgi:hypothetical protein
MPPIGILQSTQQTKTWGSGETSEDDAYFNGSGLRDDKLTGATLDYAFTDTGIT